MYIYIRIYIYIIIIYIKWCCWFCFGGFWNFGTNPIRHLWCDPRSHPWCDRWDFPPRSVVWLTWKPSSFQQLFWETSTFGMLYTEMITKRASKERGWYWFSTPLNWFLFRLQVAEWYENLGRQSGSVSPKKKKQSMDDVSPRYGEGVKLLDLCLFPLEHPIFKRKRSRLTFNQSLLPSL